MHATQPEPHQARRFEDPDLTGHIDEHGNLDNEGARRLFEAEVQYVLGIDGQEFLRRWDAGEYRHLEGTGKHSELMALVMGRPRAYAKHA